jgi:hypothetical protein
MKRAILVAALAASALPSQAFSEDCRALPKGPERGSCIKREHPEQFQARLDRCKQLALERGDTARTGTGAGGMREFVLDCLHGNQR